MLQTCLLLCGIVSQATRQIYRKTLAPYHSPTVPMVGQDFPESARADATPSSLQSAPTTPVQNSTGDKNSFLDGMGIMILFGVIFIVLVSASICMFCNKPFLIYKDSIFKNNKKSSISETQNIEHRVSINTMRTKYSPSIIGMPNTDYISSTNSNQNFSLNHGHNNNEYIIEKTTSITSPTKRWLLTDLLGRGRFGAVHLCIDLTLQQQQETDDVTLGLKDRNNQTITTSKLDMDAIKLFAVKRAMFEIGENGQNIATKECNSIYHEMKILVNLKHENIVKLSGSAVADRSILMFMEYCIIGNVSSLLKQFGPLDLITTQKFIKQLLFAIQYLHSINIVHRDIKGRNILISSSMQIKLADFGSAIIVSDTLTLKRSVSGTIHYMSPEVFKKNYSSTNIFYKHDIWSLGITTIEFVSTFIL